MIPYILAAVGGYLIGQSRKDEQYADGGMMADGGKLFTNKSKRFIFTGSDGQPHGLNYRLIGIKKDGTQDKISEHTTQSLAERKAKKWSETAYPNYTEWRIDAIPFSDGGMMATGGVVKNIKLYYHKTSGGAEYLCSEKVKGTKDEGSLNSTICVRIDGSKTYGGELIMGAWGEATTESRKEKIKLYHHKTSGGAEYLCSSKVKGTKDEGSLDSKYIVRIDGAQKHGGELMIKD